MSKKIYSMKLQDPRWQRKRLEILSRDGFSCVHCSDKETTLHVHHLKYNGEPWEARNKDLETVCKHCHKLFHSEDFTTGYNFNKIIKILDSGVYLFFVMSENIFSIYGLLDHETGTIEKMNLMPKEYLELINKYYKNNG